MTSQRTWATIRLMDEKPDDDTAAVMAQDIAAHECEHHDLTLTGDVVWHVTPARFTTITLDDGTQVEHPRFALVVRFAAAPND